MKKIKVNEVTINWLETNENGEPKFQYRNFKNEAKATEFVKTKLIQRNITNFVEKRKCSFINESSL